MFVKLVGQRFFSKQSFVILPYPTCNIFLSTDEADGIQEAAQRMGETVGNDNLNTEDGPGEG